MRKLTLREIAQNIEFWDQFIEFDRHPDRCYWVCKTCKKFFITSKQEAIDHVREKHRAILEKTPQIAMYS